MQNNIIASPVSREYIPDFNILFKEILTRDLGCTTANKPLFLVDNAKGLSEYLTIFTSDISQSEADDLVEAWNRARRNKGNITRNGVNICVLLNNGKVINIFYEKRKIGYDRYLFERYERTKNMSKSTQRQQQNNMATIKNSTEIDVSEGFYFPIGKEPIGLLRMADHKMTADSWGSSVRSTDKALDVNDPVKRRDKTLDEIKNEIKDFFVFISNTINSKVNIDECLKPIYDLLNNIDSTIHPITSTTQNILNSLDNIVEV